MIFLLRFKRYFVCTAGNLKINNNVSIKGNLLVNNNLCGIVSGTYPSNNSIRKIYEEHSSVGLQNGIALTIGDNYFGYIEVKNEYFHGIKVKINNNKLAYAGKYRYGKLHGYVINRIKDANAISDYYIGATFNNGIADKIDLIQMRNGRLIYCKTIETRVCSIFKYNRMFEALDKLQVKNYTVYRSTDNKQDYRVYKNFKQVFSYEKYLTSTDITYGIVNGYKIHIQINKMQYTLDILKEYEFHDEIMNEFYWVAMFEWNKVDIPTNCYINQQSKYCIQFRYDKCMKQWHRCNHL